MNKFNTADLCDEYNLIVADPIFKSYGAETHCHGKITTVVSFEDNSYVKKLLDSDGKGKIMVVDGKGSLKCALLGDNLAKIACNNHWAGIIINGCIRDSVEINTLPLSVKALNTNPKKSIKKDIGEYNSNLTFAGVTFEDGDYLYSDPDGIVISKEAII